MSNKDINRITYGRGYVYKIQYHIVWCTKYRKQVLNSGIDTELLQLINDVAKRLITPSTCLCVKAISTFPPHSQPNSYFRSKETAY